MSPTISYFSFIALSAASLLLFETPSHADVPGDEMLREIPVVPAAEKKRDFTTEDLLLLRDIAALSVSRDGARFAILVRQALPEKNSYRAGWFVGSSGESRLVFAGDGGESVPGVRSNGTIVGELAPGVGRWSPDGRWIAYLVRRDGEVQIWRSLYDGSTRQQVTRNAADVLDFAWSENGDSLYFTVGTPRAQLQAGYEAQARRGYPFNDFEYTSRLITPGYPPRPVEANAQVWSVAEAGTSAERLATGEERQEFERMRSGNTGSDTEPPRVATARGTQPLASSRGSWAWLAPEGGTGQRPLLRVTASLAADGSDPITCAARECAGQLISSFWWSADGKRVIFWNLDQRNGFDPVLHAWTPSSGRLATLIPGSGARFTSCEMRDDRLTCLRETEVQPLHVAAIDTRTGKISVVADVNPELKNVRLGKVERIEWDVPESLPAAGYARRAIGYVLYPPDFDAGRKYPVFIAPYVASGFPRGDVGDEHPLFAYAASGIVVLNTNFPHPTGGLTQLSGVDYMKLLYSSEHDFPHLTTLMKSTFGALDAVAKRGFVDERRVGIGGVSHGSFVPLYMLQKDDRLTAVSIAGGHWDPFNYYSSTPKGRPRNTEWYPPPFGESASWWQQVDIAQHVAEIEAPILFNFPDTEVHVSLRLLRHLENERKPFDAYVFPGEHHLKWQSAHREALYQRNLDWFRFWLQDYEDADPGKREQYARWRGLRKAQCGNVRSLRDYCDTSIGRTP